MENTIKLKVGRDTLTLDENDLILDNGACYQIVTREVTNGWYSYPPRMSKTLFNKLKKLEFVRTNSMLKENAEAKYKCSGLTYWQFNIWLMLENDYANKI